MLLIKALAKLRSRQVRRVTEKAATGDTPRFAVAGAAVNFEILLLTALWSDASILYPQSGNGEDFHSQSELASQCRYLRGCGVGDRNKRCGIGPVSTLSLGDEWAASDVELHRLAGSW